MIRLYSFLLQTEGIGEIVEQAAEHAANGAHGGGHEDSTPHMQNIVALISKWTGQPWINDWVNVIYSFMLMVLIVLFFAHVAKRLKQIPDRRQAFVETIVGGLDRFVQDILGPGGRAYVPLIGSLFIFILCMNLFGLVPLLGHSPSSNLNITLSLALFVFFTVQAHGIRQLGPFGYVRHFADLPKKPSLLQWLLAPFMFPLHIIGELAKPVSLSLRLFGNITGEDVLIAAFIMLVAFVPLHFFMYPIVLIGSCAQALVFATLSTVYILLMSPHEEEH